VPKDQPKPRRVLSYTGTPQRAKAAHSAEAIASLVAGCVNAVGLGVLFTGKLPPQVGMMVTMAALLVAMWGMGFGLYAARRNAHEPFALVGLTTNLLALVITLSLAVGACCFGISSPIAPFR
jgi:hypothetical protein